MDKKKNEDNKPRPSGIILDGAGSKQFYPNITYAEFVKMSENIIKAELKNEEK